MMNRLMLLAALGIAAASTPTTSSAQKGSMYWCRATKGIPRSRMATIYTTEILPVNGVQYADLIRAWTDYIKTTDVDASYSADCFTGDQPSIGQSRSGILETWAAGKSIESGWQYSAKMTATPSKPGAVYAWCSSGTFAGDKTVYDTGVFEIGMGDATSTLSPVENAYTKYLISRKLNKYIFQEWYSRSVACPHHYDSRTIAEEARVKAEAQWKAKGVSVVATDWIYPKNLINNAARTNSH
jgi:hypothetical protein